MGVTEGELVTDIVGVGEMSGKAAAATTASFEFAVRAPAEYQTLFAPLYERVPAVFTSICFT